MSGSPFSAGDVFVIAEIGKNFIDTEEEQSADINLRKAKALIDAACDAGADAVKFQAHRVEDEQMNIAITSPHFAGMDRYAWVKRNTEATPMSFWKEVRAHCRAKNITFFVTPMSRGAARFLAPLDPPFWKVGSGDALDFVLLTELLAQQKPVILSTGMVSFAELAEVTDFVNNRVPLAILYCVSEYPCPPEAFNLASLEDLKKKYPQVVIGFSDHSLGDEAALAAIRCGAGIIEKHFSFSRTLWGADHKASLAPPEFAAMVQKIRSRSYGNRDVQPFLGESGKELAGAANRFRPYFEKALVAAHDLSAGTVLSGEDIYAMRPASLIPGLPAKSFPKIPGNRIAKDLKKYDPIASSTLSKP